MFMRLLQTSLYAQDFRYGDWDNTMRCHRLRF